MMITVFVCINFFSHLPSQLGIFVFTFTVKRFHIYGALLHLALKVFTLTGPYYIFTFRGATGPNCKYKQTLFMVSKINAFTLSDFFSSFKLFEKKLLSPPEKQMA